MLELLGAAQEFIGNDKFKGIRISTRPDYISTEILDILRDNHVTAIELGAQSMSDVVLEANERGHTVQDVENAAKLPPKKAISVCETSLTSFIACVQIRLTSSACGIFSVPVMVR